MKALTLTLCFWLAACAPFRLIQPRSAERTRATSLVAIDCSALQTPYLVWGGLAVGLATLAGVSGVSTLAPKGNPDGSPSSAQLGLAVSSVVIGAMSATSTFVAGWYASRVAKCVSP